MTAALEKGPRKCPYCGQMTFLLSPDGFRCSDCGKEGDVNALAELVQSGELTRDQPQTDGVPASETGRVVAAGAFVRRITSSLARCETAFAKLGLQAGVKCSKCGAPAGMRGDGVWCSKCENHACGVEACARPATRFLQSRVDKHIGQNRYHRQTTVNDDFPVCDRCFDRIVQFRRGYWRATALMTVGGITALASMAIPIGHMDLEQLVRRSVRGGSGGATLENLAVVAFVGFFLVFLGNVVAAFASRTAPRRRKRGLIVGTDNSWAQLGVPHVKGWWVQFWGWLGR